MAAARAGSLTTPTPGVGLCGECAAALCGLRGGRRCRCGWLCMCRCRRPCSCGSSACAAGAPTHAARSLAIEWQPPSCGPSRGVAACSTGLEPLAVVLPHSAPPCGRSCAATVCAAVPNAPAARPLSAATRAISSSSAHAGRSPAVASRGATSLASAWSPWVAASSPMGASWLWSASLLSPPANKRLRRARLRALAAASRSVVACIIISKTKYTTPFFFSLRFSFVLPALASPRPSPPPPLPTHYLYTRHHHGAHKHAKKKKLDVADTAVTHTNQPANQIRKKKKRKLPQHHASWLAALDWVVLDASRLLCCRCLPHTHARAMGVFSACPTTFRLVLGKKKKNEPWCTAVQWTPD